MPRSAAGTEALDQRGFTLIELLVALLIVAVVSAVAALALPRGSQQRMQREADRLAALFDAARQQAASSGQPLAWVAGADGYAFARIGPQGWELLRQPPLQPQRWSWLDRDGPPPGLVRSASATLQAGPVAVALAGGIQPAGASPNWLVFGSEPVQPAMRVSLSRDGAIASVGSDGLQAFQVSWQR